MRRLRCVLIIFYLGVCACRAEDAVDEASRRLLEAKQFHDFQAKVVTRPERLKIPDDFNLFYEREKRRIDAARRGSTRTYPLWDGIESAEAYATRVGLPPTLQLDLGQKTSVAMVLIPAGQVTMGTDWPQPPQVSPFRTVESQSILGLGAAFVIGLLIVPLGRAWRLRERPVFSIRWLMIFSLGASLIVFGIVRLCQPNPWDRYAEALSRYRHVPMWENIKGAQTIPQPFYLGKYKLTQFQACRVYHCSPLGATADQLPRVVSGEWEACHICDLVNGLVKEDYAQVQLPTEAEWEFACKAGTTFDYYVDDMEQELDAVAWYSRNSGGVRQPVGLKRPNSFGLFDMIGDVQEFTTAAPDWPYGKYTLRGAAWNSEARCCRAASRQPQRPEFEAGIRLALPCWVAETAHAAP